MGGGAGATDLALASSIPMRVDAGQNTATVGRFSLTPRFSGVLGVGPAGETVSTVSPLAGWAGP